MKNFKLVVLLIAVMPSLGIYRGCDHRDPNFTEIRHANQRWPYDLSRSRAIALQGGWKDTLLVGDDLDWHGQEMRIILVEFGIPEQNLSFTLGRWNNPPSIGNLGLLNLVSGEYESLREKSRVVHLPLFMPFVNSSDVTNVRDNNILFVTGTGNTYIFDDHAQRLREYISRNPWEEINNWDPWNPEHPGWRPEIFYPYDLTFSKIAQSNIIDLAQGGKVIFATSAQVNSDGVVVPERRVMRCGVMLQDACFTILPVQYTSNASAQLAAMAFYLAQFYDTPEEIVDVLERCAIDVGEEGVDVEYGHGIATLLCAPVIEKEVDIILSYSSAPAARSVRNVLHALRGEPEFEEFVRAMFLQ